MNIYRVVIIGAGPAGFAAAARLLEYNVRDILILEAENRIGGRVFTSELEDNLVELGAEWIHGEKGNVVYELASKFDLADTQAMTLSLFPDTTFYRTDRQIDKGISQRLCELYAKIIYADPDSVEDSSGSLGDYFAKEYKKGIEELRQEIDVSDALLKEFLDIFEKWENLIDASHSWYETSLTGHWQYWECDGNLVTVWKGNGYSTIFDLLEKKPPYGQKSLNINEIIKLNKEVTKINWNKTCVPGVPNVTVECRDGTKYFSDHVIFTCSLGVLKECARHMFQPVISDKKLMAIDKIGFGTVDKIFLKFPYAWWDKDTDGFGFLWSEEDKKNDTTGWLSEVVAFHPVREESTVLRGWIVGEAARLMETLTNDEVIDGCMQLMNRFMGFKYKIPRAEGILKSSWYTNPHFRGSYSCRVLETEEHDVWAADLAQPEFDNNGIPVLLFAGEATHDHYFSTVHGAIESGMREADRLLKQSLHTNGIKDRYDVVIVGAGISGLAAAKTLIESGMTDVLILEAQDTPGGRIKSLKVDNDWLELGAQWIHGDKNEMFDICKKHNLVTDKYSREGQGLYLREDGTVVDETIVNEMDDFVKTVLENCEEFVGNVRGNAPNSIGDELMNKFDEYLNNCNDSDAVKDVKMDLFHWHVRFHLIDNSCDDLRDLSAKGWGLFRFCGGNDYVNFKNGYRSIVDVMLSYIPQCKILYSTPVSGIRWNESVQLESCPQRQSSARVFCDDGIAFDADYVIVTSSIGWLKKNHQKLFSPPLPSYLSEAINSVGYGVLGKIFLIYNKPWWDPDVKGFQLLWSHKRFSDASKRHWSVDVTGFDVIIEGRPILLGWVAGDGARTIESMTESDIGIESTEILRRFMNDSSIPLPDKVFKSRWFNNEYIQGGYSHITVEYDKNGIDGTMLSRPVYTDVSAENDSFKKPTLLLAGEAAHKTHYSTVHGAFESGVSQARVIIDYVRSRR